MCIRDSRRLFTNADGSSASRGRDLDGISVVIVGDLAHSRVARSNLWLLTALRANVTFVAPETLQPYGARDWPVTVRHDFDEAIEKDQPDVVMMLRIQSERMHAAYFPNEREYARNWGLGDARFGALPERTIVMHPVSYTHLDVYKRQGVAVAHADGEHRPDHHRVCRW